MKLPEVKKLQELINVSSEILLILDREGNIIYSNKSINLLGYTPEEVISKPFSKLVAGHQRLNIEKKLLTSAKKGKKIFYKILLRTKEAATLSGEINGVHNGENYFLSIKVIENENVPRDILDTLESGILLVDEDMKIIYHNPYVSHVFENRRYTHLKQLPYGIGQKVEEFIKRGAQTAEIQIPSGRFFGIRFAKFESASFSGIMIHFRDITEQKLMERAMAEFDRFSSLGQLASGLAHEIKNPLAGMKLMALRLKRELNNENKEIVDRMIRQIDRIDSLIKTLFSQVKAQMVHFTKCNLENIAEDIRELVSTELLKNGIFFDMQVSTRPFVIADCDQVHTILLNLVLNAIDSVKQVKGERRIEIVITNSPAKCPNCGVPFISLEVRDTGTGIKKEDIDKIFYPFFTTKPEGTGLGLFLVHKLVKENKGLINVKSQYNQGSTFIVYLHSVNAGAEACFGEEISSVL
ncbi:MAG: hypothetical protein DRQ03_03835 [Candidatus Hydrothermota bacterium]|nr:MAG: hypothetical protein DRQ03_03835 [Candidatus Hydrothermae bacterium]